MSRTFIKEFRGDYSHNAIQEANEYAKNNNLEIIAIDSHLYGTICYLMVVFKRFKHE